MPLDVPKLDDRSFQNLVDEAKQQIKDLCPQWTDHNVSDPGITLIELFAYMTEQYLYRLNQVPEKNFITFLNLLGTRLEPPQAATGEVTFTLTRSLSPDEQSPIIIPLGTEVATQRTGVEEAIVFTTDREARPSVTAETLGITVPVTQAQAMPPLEILGISDGQPSQKFSLANRPILQPEPDEVVEVEDDHGNWEAWTPVSDFGDSADAKKHYVIDLAAGLIEFGPKIRQRNGKDTQFGAIPPRGRRVRIRRYRVGGGVRGNVGANTVTVLRSTIPYISAVSNHAPMVGGLEAQTLEDARLQMLRQLRVPARAVTANDFEYLAQQVQGVGRVRCSIPEPIKPETTGTVKLLVIPQLPGLKDPEKWQQYLDDVKLAGRDNEKLKRIFQVPPETTDRLMAALIPCLLLTTSVESTQPEYIWVRVVATVEAKKSARRDLVQRVTEALHIWLHPLFGGSDGKGWPFGGELTISKVYELIDRIEGVHTTVKVELWQLVKNKQNEWDFEQKENRIKVDKDAVIASAFHKIINVK